jgi:hypothetical protein
VTSDQEGSMLVAGQRTRWSLGSDLRAECEELGPVVTKPIALLTPVRAM